jgi:HlyD family secretion protein
LVFAAVSIISRKPTEIRVPMVTPPSSTFTESISGIGIVEPASELIAVGTEIPGIVRRVYVKVGDQVTTGTPLFQLDQREIDAQIGSLKAALSSAQLQAEEAKSQFATLEALHDRRAVSKDEFVRREYAAKVGKAKVAEIQAQLREALTTKARLTVGSPMNGEILEVNIRPGEFASTAGTSEPLIRMGDTRELHIRVEVDEQYSGRVSASSAAYGSPRGNTSLRIPLKFVRFERFVKPKVNLATGGQRVDTRVLEVVYSLTPTENPIFVGQQMDVFIDATRAN